MHKLKAALQELAAQAKANKIHKMAEMQVQSSYVIKVLELLGWKDSDWKLGAPQEVRTGKIPDIRLHDKSKHTVLVLECKDAKKLDKLDGRYGNKTFEQQLYGYCRAEGINWGILTNFVEWRLYNETLTRLYEDKKYAFLDLLWPGANPKAYVDILSDEGLAFLSKFQRTPLCLAKGKVDTNPVYYPIEKQIEDIKAKFFIKLKGWRDSLRRELHKNYGEKYEKDQIDLYTQKILDRMIFMEVCHDKGIIGQDILSAILNSHISKYDELKKRFKEMDEQFNTELFAPMAIDHFDIDDKVMVPIIKELNEIDFEHVTVHIIGEVYENYLGEMLRVTKKSGLKMQEHKEQAKRKSQGIYYTPEYIVDYIVKNTVGELVKKAQTEDDLKKIKILDPACGSGSFLIKAFDVMYDAYENLKIDKKGGQLETRKDLKIKRAILQHNLYGVDLDDRAVEITKLNLMLKALEGFSFHELKGRKLLPNLNLNIRVGNSLISGQTFEQLAEQNKEPTLDGMDEVVDIKPLLKLHKNFYHVVEDEEKERLIKEIEIEERRLNRKLGDNLKGYFSNLEEIKPLNYQVAFPEVFQVGGPSARSGQGFDAVIGNPPYIGFHGFAEVKDYFAQRYVSAKGKFDYYLPFLEKGLEVLNSSGLMSVICPANFMKRGHGLDLRKYLKEKITLVHICDFQDVQVFEDALNYTGIYVFKKETPSKNHNISVKLRSINDSGYKVKQSNLDDEAWILRDEKENSIIHKIKTSPNTLLGHMAEAINEGIVTGNNDVFIVSKETIDENQLEGELIKPSLRGRNIRKYHLGEINDYIIYPYKDVNGKTKSLMEQEISSCKNIWKYLQSKRNKLKGRPYFEASTKYWYELWCQRDINLLTKQKIVVPELADSNRFALADSDIFYGDTVCGITFNNIQEDIRYILALLNSKLITYFYKSTTVPKANQYFIYKTMYLKNIPVRRIDFKNNKDKTIHDQLVKLVKEMLKLNKTPELRQRHAADVAVIDKEIDELVYSLYGLSEAERKVVEGV